MSTRSEGASGSAVRGPSPAHVARGGARGPPTRPRWSAPARTSESPLERSAAAAGGIAVARFDIAQVHWYSMRQYPAIFIHPARTTRALPSLPSTSHYATLWRQVLIY